MIYFHINLILILFILLYNKIKVINCSTIRVPPWFIYDEHLYYVEINSNVSYFLKSIISCAFLFFIRKNQMKNNYFIIVYKSKSRSKMLAIKHDNDQDTGKCKNSNAGLEENIW